MMNESRDLPTIQRWMQSAIMHPGGLQAGIDSPQARSEINLGAAQLDSVIAPSRHQTSFERLEVYSNSYLQRLVECLESEFPALVAALGLETFRQFSLDYLHAHPSQSYTLGDLGARFPQFLRETRPIREDEAAPDWADFLIDLATLERLYSEVFDGPGAERLPLLSAEALSALSPGQWAHSRLIPVPCLRLVALTFPVHEYVSSVRQQQAAEMPAALATRLVVTRRDFIVRRHAVDPLQFELLGRLVEGLPIGEAIENVAGRFEGKLDELAQQLRSWFAAWSAAQLFLRLEPVE